MTTEIETKNNLDETNNKEVKADLVPLDKFLQIKKERKELAEKLAAFEDRDKKLEEAKLLEEKKFQELIKAKENEALNFKNELELTKKQARIDKIQDKFLRVLEKNNAINSDDALKFVNINDILESDDIDSDVATKVADLLKNKSYLFNQQKTQRSNSENGLPIGNVIPTKPTNRKIDPVIDQLNQLFRT